MSALQLLEKLGSTARLNRSGADGAAVIRKQLFDLLEPNSTTIKQWCVMVPAEDDETPPEDDKKDSDKESKIELN